MGAICVQQEPFDGVGSRRIHREHSDQCLGQVTASIFQSRFSAVFHQWPSKVRCGHAYRECPFLLHTLEGSRPILPAVLLAHKL
jgi:hypothetical protein